MRKNNVFLERKALILNDADTLHVQPCYKGIRKIELLRTWLKWSNLLSYRTRIENNAIRCDQTLRGM